MAKISKNEGQTNCSGRAVEHVPWGERHILKHQDEKAFATAADKYAATHVTSEKKARSALRKMGIITPTGRLSKHYK